MSFLDKLVPLALWLVIIGGLNWLLVGLFNFNLVTWLASVLHFMALEKIIYVVVGISALICFRLLRGGMSK